MKKYFAKLINMKYNAQITVMIFFYAIGNYFNQP